MTDPWHIKPERLMDELAERDREVRECQDVVEALTMGSKKAQQRIAELEALLWDAHAYLESDPSSIGQALGDVIRKHLEGK